MTKDLAICIHGNQVAHNRSYLYTEKLLEAIDVNLRKKLGR